jgi:ZIP family zinc transporter
MDTLVTAMLLATIAGATIPVGALLARHEHIRIRWLETEFRHIVVAFGGGVLMAAVSLVLVPDGIEHLSLLWICIAFGGGGYVFMLVDRAVAQHGGAGAQLMAMLLDFVPEAMAVGAALAMNRPAGLLLALLIALQNLPEGFNAYRELSAHSRRTPNAIILSFSALVLLGPAMALVGHMVLAMLPALLGGMMLFAAGGIVYLTFQDIAPQAVYRGHWAPPLATVAGFLLGLIGKVLLVH